MRKSTSKTFVTLFPFCENSHLIKDIGQIPWFLNTLYGYDASVVGYRISKAYFHQEGEVKGLKLRFISDTGKFLFAERAVISYLLKNGKNIDILNLYHFTKQTFVYGIVYKMVNPGGFLYVKLDAYNEALKANIPYSTKKVKHAVLKRLEKIFLKKTDLFSVENTEGEALFSNKYPVAHKTIYLPNGVNDLFLKTNFPGIRKYEEKENILLTTGRIGLKVKNHEMILKSLVKIEMKDWKFCFVGAVHPEFMDFYNKFCEEHPQLKNTVFFAGEVTDRKELYEWYNRAKIFCLTSPYESFGISMAEAMYFGNYVVGTEGISSFKDLTDNGSYGASVRLNDYDTLAEVITKIINNEVSIASKCEAIKKFARTSFLWSGITGGLKNRFPA